MAKRKNPLKDLDAFLKQEAKSFVEPKKVEPKPEVAAEPSAYQAKEVEEAPIQTAQATTLDIAEVKEYLIKMRANGDTEFLDLLLKVAEDSDTNSSKNKMLINTILYLKDQENWKENIKEYWS